MTKTAQQRLGAAEIATKIRREITLGNLTLHERLPPERLLADTYGVARGTVRQALTLLENLGYVNIRRGSGTYVTHEILPESDSPIRHANPLELMDARFALEPHTCRLAVLHGRRSDFDHLDGLCDRMEQSINAPQEFAHADTEFHRALVQCTRNSLMIWMTNQITAVRGQDEWTRMRHLTLEADIIVQYNRQHRDILNAVRLREPENAANAMKQHLETARLSLTRAVET